ncbi:unnamed protein product [Staurois parvus]|uniref:Uncharacterized protein n=1 Tax=Staurois parvus TaxID=386267 RepID=A0ABN9H4W0_9NEOB|nr:unnamed protein product [Staurois parvus]
MQTASANICEKMAISPSMKCPCTKYSRSTISGIITKWKQLGTTATQPQSDRPHKMKERGHAETQSAQKLTTICRVNS